MLSMLKWYLNNRLKVTATHKWLKYESENLSVGLLVNIARQFSFFFYGVLYKNGLGHLLYLSKSIFHTFTEVKKCQKT